MSEDGVDIIIMDDGHQNPDLAKDLSLIVIDGKYRFGNGYVIPKGPLRESIDRGLERADAIVLFGDREGLALPTNLPVISAKIQPLGYAPRGPVVAFAGIGKPEKFFDTLRELNTVLLSTVPFPDHHSYSKDDLSYLLELAADHDAKLITTEKDFFRLPEEFRANVSMLPVTVEFEPLNELDRLLALALKQRSQ